jgi:hypothetical protein
MTLMRSFIDDYGLEHYEMERIEVDGIVSWNDRNYGYQFFNIKSDTLEPLDYYDDLASEEEGYIDDRKGFVPWDSAYSGLPLSLGEINEEVWLKDGIITTRKDFY